MKAASKNMTSVILVPSAETDWQAGGRFATRTPISVNQQGRAEIATWARQLAVRPPAAIYSADRDPAAQTAHDLAESFHLRAKKADRLEEMALGLWEGLTPEDLAKRFARAFRQWKEDPSSVCPPEGEALPAAAERVIKEVGRLGRKHLGQCFAVVLGPLALAALRCHLEGKDCSALWEMTSDKPIRYALDPEACRPIMSR